MLASIDVPLATEAIKGLFGKGMHTSPPPPPASRVGRSPGNGGRGMQVNSYRAHENDTESFDCKYPIQFTRIKY